MARALTSLCGFRLANTRWVYLGPFIDGIYGYVSGKHYLDLECLVF